MVFAFLSSDVDHLPSMYSPMGTSTVPLKAEWVNSWVKVGAMVSAATCGTVRGVGGDYSLFIPGWSSLEKRRGKRYDRQDGK